MFRTVIFLSVCVLGATAMLVSTAADSISEPAKKLHFSAIVVDTHDDTTQRLLHPDFDIAARHSNGNIDIPRMRDGGLSALFSWVSKAVT